LITGESGAGKTENTKRVIQYLTAISSASLGNLERQLILANVLLEAFGNAQTVRNNNSSRFGKFIRIEIDPTNGHIVGANIEKYLLEKSRVTHRAEGERSFHIFYQLLSGASDAMLAALKLTRNAQDYAFLARSTTAIAGVDDAAHFQQLLEALDVIGLTAVEQEDIFKVLAVVLLLGQLQVSEDEVNGQAELMGARNHQQVTDICQLLGVPQSEFVSALLNPEIRAGRDVVQQARGRGQVERSLEALSRTLYERLFSWLVDRLNTRLFRQGSNQSSGTPFIGVLDIAGFEIFTRNSLEQLLINYTNERLQQFFNHHMFVVEQAEYRREGLAWEFMDFGLDAQPMIDLLESANPVGILACLDEDCVMPRTTDKSFTSKLAQLIAQSNSSAGKFAVDRFTHDTQFALKHYAGTVQYHTSGWLEKNKDPLNEAVARVLTQSQAGITAALFMEYNSNTPISGRQQKAGIFRTVAQKHRESLQALMQQLSQTQPHFVRCIVPNSEKQAGLFVDALVHEQLNCNGVLEGIRICRQGFPNRLRYADFWRLYSILLGTNNNAKSNQQNDPEIIKATLRAMMGWEEGVDYALGSSKLFFRAGRLGRLDARRDAHLAHTLRSLQAACRGTLQRIAHERVQRQAEAAKALAQTLRAYLKFRTWPWGRLLARVKPLLVVSRADMRIRELSGKLESVSKEAHERECQLKNSIDLVTSELESLKQRAQQLQRDKDQLQESLAVFAIRETEMQMAHDRLQGDLHLKQEELARASEHAGAQAKELCALKITLEEEMTDKLNSLTLESRELQDQLHLKQQQLKQAHDELTRHRESSQLKEQSLHLQLATITTQLNVSQEQCEKSAKDLEAERKTVATLTSELASNQSILVAKEQETAELLNAIKERESNVIDMESRIAELQAEVQNVLVEMEEGREKTTAVEEELRLAREDKEQLSVTISLLKEELIVTADQIKLIASYEDTLQQELADSREKTVKLQDALKEQREEFDRQLCELRTQHQEMLKKQSGDLTTQLSTEFGTKLAAQQALWEEQKASLLHEAKGAANALTKQRLSELQNNLESEHLKVTNQLQGRICELEDLEAELKMTIGSLQNTLNEKRGQIQVLEASVDDAIQKAQQQATDASSRQATLSAQLIVLQEQLATESASHESVRQALSKQEAATAQIDAELKRLQQSSKRERERLEGQVRDALKKRDEVLEREEELLVELKEVQDRLELERKSLRSSQDHEIQLEAEVKSLQVKLKLSTDHLEASKSDHLRSSRNQSQAVQRVADLEAQLAEIQDQLLIKDEQVSCSEQVCALIKTELVESQGLGARLKEENADLLAQVDQLTAQLKKLQYGGFNQSRTSVASSALDDVVEKIQISSHERQALLQENRKLERQHKEASDRIVDLQKLLDEHVQKERSLSERQASTSIQCDQLINARDEADRTIRRLERALVDEKERSERLLRDLDRWKGSRLSHRLERSPSTSSTILNSES